MVLCGRLLMVILLCELECFCFGLSTFAGVEMTTLVEVLGGASQPNKNQKAIVTVCFVFFLSLCLEF